MLVGCGRNELRWGFFCEDIYFVDNVQLMGEAVQLYIVMYSVMAAGSPCVSCRQDSQCRVDPRQF